KGEGVPFDPEGLMSALPAIIQVVLGYLVGVLIRHQGEGDWLWKRVPSSSEPHFNLVASLLVSGFLLLVLGWALSLGFPINKIILTISYVLYTSGLGVVTLGTMVWFVEVQGFRNKLSQFFDLFGKNPLFIFVLSGLLPKTMALIRVPISTEGNGEVIFGSPLTWFYRNICAQVPLSSLLCFFVNSLVLLVVM